MPGEESKNRATVYDTVFCPFLKPEKKKRGFLLFKEKKMFLGLCPISAWSTFRNPNYQS